MHLGILVEQVIGGLLSLLDHDLARADVGSDIARRDAQHLAVGIEGRLATSKAEIRIREMALDGQIVWVPLQGELELLHGLPVFTPPNLDHAESGEREHRFRIEP